MNETTNQFLLTFEIGPVEEFIVNSRKTQDAWLGSYIISHLMSCAVKAIVSDFTEDAVVYPAVKDQPLWDKDGDSEAKRISTFPDRIMAVVPENRIDECVKMAKQAVQDAWKGIWEYAQKELNIGNTNIWKRQCESFFTIYWAASPNGSDKEEALKEHSCLMDAVNSSRLFEADEEKGTKCSLSGRLSALPDGRYSEVQSHWSHIATQGKFGLLFDRHERLSAVYAAKRLAGRYLREQLGSDPRFPSTASFTAAPTVEQAITNAGALQTFHTVFEKFRELLEGTAGRKIVYPEIGIPRLLSLTKELRAKDAIWLATLDGEWLFTENYSLDHLVNEYTPGADDVARDNLKKSAEIVLSALSSLLSVKTNDKKHSIKPRPYYAILTMDGDDFTKFRKTVNDSREFTKALLKFGLGQAREIVEGRCRGRLVYSGGDELLAFLPACDAVNAAVALRKEIGQIREGAVASFGIAISHYRTPLRFAIQEANTALHSAKSGNKNRVQVKVLKRSGAPVTADWQWSDGHSTPDQLIERTAELIRSKQLGRKFVFDLAEDADILNGLDKESIITDAKRLVRRHFPVESDPNANSAREGYLEMLRNILESTELSEVVTWLELAEWLGRDDVV